ncbi:MAG TPA: T9SS type A sorting domain-containing protein, partial [Bacteroidota bacterium]|nr:T9SS type A sorting domain-containing protein [Bacteroidota bacterium]
NQNEDPHYYELHIWGPGLDTLLKTRDTSLSVTPFPTMQDGQTYRWHVWIKDEFTEVSSRDTFQVLYRSSSTDVKPDGTVQEFRLMQNYPNPFNPSTRILFTIHRMVSVRLRVYDVLGREVATLVNEVKSPGTYDVQWDASGQPSGIYFYKLEAGNLSAVRKMVFIR